MAEQEEMMNTRWIWPFELEKKIGEGGMGVVYRGRYVKNDRRVAVKLLPHEISANSTVVARFERELEVLRKLKHPHIVHCFGGICEDKQRFYAMELVEGGSVGEILSRRGRLPWELAIDYAVQLCSALAYAHERGVIHRDVKPANLLLTRTGKLKLSDFGLASVTAESRLTAADKTAGTLHYMAPEQIRGTPELSPKTDLYALGCVLYEMIVGTPPFTGDTPAQILQQHLKMPAPRAAAQTLDCPAALDQLISELLAKDPGDRPADAESVGRRLQEISQTVVVQQRTKSPEKKTISPEVEEESPPNSKPVQAAPAWLLIAGGAVCLLLLVWNASLMRTNRQLARSQELWVEAYRSGEDDVRMRAADALGKIGATNPHAVDILVEGLEEENLRIRAATVEALGESGVNAKGLLSTLRKIENTDEWPTVRTAAKEAQEKIRSAEPESSAWLYSTLAVVIVLIVGGTVARSYFSNHFSSRS